VAKPATNDDEVPSFKAMDTMTPSQLEK